MTAAGDLFDLAGRAALVTGGSSGIGRRMVCALAEAGAAVVLVGRRALQLTEAAAAIEAAGGRAAGVTRDLADPADMAALAADAAAPFGAPDILVNADGVNLRDPPDTIKPESWHRTPTLHLPISLFLAPTLLCALPDTGEARDPKTTNPHPP